MLLQRLVEYARNLPDASPSFHRSLEFRWQLDLTSEGEPAGDRTLLPLVDPEQPKRGLRHVVPATTRTVGVAPNLAADDIQYVLGWADDTVKPDRVADCHEAFRDLMQTWAADNAAAGDPVVQAAARFFARPASGRVRRPGVFSSKDRVLISVEGSFLYRRPSVATFWATEVASRKGGTRSGLCLVCGKTAPLLDTVPGKVPSRILPGATNDAALVSVNERVFGYDLSTQLAHTPICLECGEAASVGLLTALEQASTPDGGQDSRTTWWTVGGNRFNPMELTARADPTDVAAFLDRMSRGSRPERIPQSEKFCSLTVGGNVARVMVRDWVEMPLQELESHVQQWFNDMETAAVSVKGRRHHGLGALTRACGRWDRQRKRYTDMGDKTADRPPDARRYLNRAAIRGEALPPALLAHLLRRIALDGHVDDSRAALIRLCLNRSRPNRLSSSERPPMPPDLAPELTDPAYVAGRLFAVLEQIQYDVSGGKLNTTYADRYFAGALTSPRVAIIAGRGEANAWLKKLRRTKGGAAINHEKRLDELFLLVQENGDLPARCNLLQQGRFILGYHHERARHFAGIRDSAERRAQAESASVEPDQDTLDDVMTTEESN